jgi:hypothetical protein
VPKRDIHEVDVDDMSQAELWEETLYQLQVLSVEADDVFRRRSARARLLRARDCFRELYATRSLF